MPEAPDQMQEELETLRRKIAKTESLASESQRSTVPVVINVAAGALLVAALGFSWGVYTSLAGQIGVLSTAVAHNEERNTAQTRRMDELRTDVGNRLDRIEQMLGDIRASLPRVNDP